MIYSMARLNERGMVIGNITELKSNRKLKKGDKVMIKIGLSGAKAAFTILGRIH